MVAGYRAAWQRLTTSFARWLPAQRPAVIVGGGPQATALLHHLSSVADPAFRIAGFFEDDNAAPGLLHGRLPCLGHVRDLPAYVAAQAIDEVFVAMSWASAAPITAVLERLRFLPVTVRLLPEHLPPALPSPLPGSLAGIVMPTLMVPPFSERSRLAKRLFDLVLACLLLVALAPVFAAIAVAVRLNSNGPVLFRQARIGEFGRRFSILKFRTLYLAQADAGAETLVGHDDRRVTRVGRVLRRYSLDELPQIVNVLRGDMSLVGPRPHAARAKADGQVYAEILPDYLLRYRVKPGMTGWAQVNGWRGNTDTVAKLRHRVEFDFQYIQRWSFGLDIYILLRTIPSMVAPAADNT